jgi:4-hydroxy-tetrahydrodipicolinate synthase
MNLAGVFIPLVTPFDGAGALAAKALERLAHQVLDDGAAGVVALGTTGEPGSLTDEERALVLEVVARVSRERDVPLIVGANGLREVRALSARPEVSAALSLVPPFIRPGQAGVEAYFRSLAAASPVPLIVYHVPQRTGQELGPDTLRSLAEIPNVVGVKYATGRVDAETIDFMNGVPEGFAVLAGDDVLLAPLLALGARGGILASAHLATPQFVRFVDAWRAGDVRAARPLGHRLAALSSAVFAEPNPTVLKAVLRACDRIPSSAVRFPLLPAGSPAVQTALARLAELGESDAGVSGDVVARRL